DRRNHSTSLYALKQKADLELEHARRIDVGEARQGVGRGAHRGELTERRIHGRCVAVRRLRASEDVRVIEQVEPLEPEENRTAGAPDAPLEEDRGIQSARALER